jgi:site-specific recombinase XerD
MRKLDPLIEGYLSYLADVGRKTPRTVIDVRCTMGRIVEGMEQIRPGVALWKLGLEDYLRWLESQRESGCTASSLAKYLSHVRGLLDYAWRSGRSERNVLDGFQLQDASPRTPPRSLTLEEAQRLVESCPRGTAAQRRERLMILVLYGCGLRTHELCTLDVGDVHRERHELQVLHAKGDRPRVVPVPEGVYTELLAYLLERGGRRGPLFKTAHRARRISAKDVCEVVRLAAQRAKLDGLVTARTLRHTYATHLMDRGVDLAIIASLMGHRSPAETGVYLHVLPHRREEAVRLLGKGAQS